jgi:hypothetical protein
MSSRVQWTAPLCVLVALVLVLRVLGPSALAGAGVALIVLGINYRASGVFHEVMDQVMKFQVGAID